ncbi:hypothetical protein NMY22_g7786 [Coprinellus aureogranulatus]|nr:hypothetical protein NMY22_g7786 [Coprinellus aureogranulatus]
MAISYTNPSTTREFDLLSLSVQLFANVSHLCGSKVASLSLEDCMTPPLRTVLQYMGSQLAPPIPIKAGSLQSLQAEGRVVVPRGCRQVQEGTRSLKGDHWRGLSIANAHRAGDLSTSNAYWTLSNSTDPPEARYCRRCHSPHREEAMSASATANASGTQNLSPITQTSILRFSPIPIPCPFSGYAPSIATPRCISTGIQALKVAVGPPSPSVNNECPSTTKSLFTHRFPIPNPSFKFQLLEHSWKPRDIRTTCWRPRLNESKEGRTNARTAGQAGRHTAQTPHRQGLDLGGPTPTNAETDGGKESKRNLARKTRSSKGDGILMLRGAKHPHVRYFTPPPPPIPTHGFL